MFLIEHACWEYQQGIVTEVLNTPFQPWPSYTDEEAEAVSKVLLSNRVNYWTGEECKLFEKEFAAWVGTPHAIALANGTLALDLALHGLGIGSVNGGNASDEVIVTPRSFIASVSCVVNAGAVPVFADVESGTGNISADTIKTCITKNTKGVIPVHLAGLPCDMDPICALAARHDFKVIEDCAQAHGARYKGKSVGAIGHVGAWSFCQDKIITTGGEGGMVTCHDAAIWSRMWSYKDHGKSYDAKFKRKHPPGFQWLHESFGTNWRMLEMQAAIGRIQLKRMPEWTSYRRRIASLLSEVVAKYSGQDGITILPPMRCASCNGCDSTTECSSAFYRFYFYIKPAQLKLGWSRDRIIEEIKSLGVPAYQGSCSEIYLEGAFDRTVWRPRERLPSARELGETSVMMLVHPTLTIQEIELSRRVLSKVLSDATRGEDF